MGESRYEVIDEWYTGFAAGMTRKPRDAFRSDHWCAGWDAAYEHRNDSRELLDKYLDSIGLQKSFTVRLQGS